jgi:membrane fusion protein (multidrug efflux system)
LKGGERLIVEGLQNVSEGLVVNATPASSADNGEIPGAPALPQSGSSQ